MKNTRSGRLIGLCFAVALMVLASCSEGRNTAEMTGTYVNRAQNEHSEVIDTLILSQENEDWFRLLRKTAYRLVEQGPDAPWQYEQEHWRARYDASQDVLLEQAKGKRIYWQQDTLRVERRKYLRLNNAQHD